MVNDKRLLGKREKCSYMYEDLNMDSVAIDLNHDLIVDKRKHTRNDHRNEVSDDGSEEDYEDSAEFHQQIEKKEEQHVSSIFKTTRRMQGIVKGTLGRERDGESLFGLKTSLFQRVQNVPSKLIGMPVVTPLTAFNSNTIQIRTNDQRNINRIGQPLSSFASGAQPFNNPNLDYMNNRWSGQRGVGYGYEPEGYSQGFCFAPKMNSLRFQKMADIGLEELDSQFADGQIFYQSSQKFKSVKGVLYQVMEEIEEYELLLK
jgi:hypothetical protein